MPRVDPLAPPINNAPETAAEELAFERAQLGSLNLIPVSCGEFGHDVPAMADLTNRIVVPRAQ